MGARAIRAILGSIMLLVGVFLWFTAGENLMMGGVGITPYRDWHNHSNMGMA